MAGRWECRYTTDDFVNEMAREMYFRDWRRAMQNVQFNKDRDNVNLKISFRNYDNSLNYNGTTPFGVFYLSK
jgi:hypothetical protein